jgi:lysophospholipase L1-like esterase
MEQWRSLNVRQRLYWRIGRDARRVHGRGPLVVAIGDSLTDPSSGSTLPWQVWLRRVARGGYRTVNLGVSGETTADMRHRVEQMLSQGRPDIAVLFGGANDALQRVDPAETEDNVTHIVRWLRDQGVQKIVLIGPGLINWSHDATDWAALDEVRRVLARVAARYDTTFVDLAGLLRGRIDRGEDPDFARVPYRQSRSWHVKDGDPHFNAYGQRLVAEAFLAAIADWRRPGWPSAH